MCYKQPRCIRVLFAFSLAMVLLFTHTVLFENKPLKVMVEFSLEQPKGGVHFVIPPGSASDSPVSEIKQEFLLLSSS